MIPILWEGDRILATKVNEKELNELVKKMMGELKGEKDIDAFTKALRKQFWEATLEGEMDDNLFYSKHDTAGGGTGNSRNGKSRKNVKSELGELEIESPRDRQSTFEPKSIKKRQSQVKGIDDKILFLYAKGQSTRI